MVRGVPLMEKSRNACLGFSRFDEEKDLPGIREEFVRKSNVRPVKTEALAIIAAVAPDYVQILAWSLPPPSQMLLQQATFFAGNLGDVTGGTPAEDRCEPLDDRAAPPPKFGSPKQESADFYPA